MCIGQNEKIFCKNFIFFSKLFSRNVPLELFEPGINSPGPTGVVKIAIFSNDMDITVIESSSEKTGPLGLN